MLRWLTPWQALLMAGAALILNGFFLHGITRGVLLRPEERASRFSRGVVLYPAVLLVTFIVFRSRLELAAGIWALLAVGDGMAALSGLVLRGPACPGIPRSLGRAWSHSSCSGQRRPHGSSAGRNGPERGRSARAWCPAGC